MMSTSCRSLESLHYLDSWNRHCGGGWWEFTSRSITLTDSILLLCVGIVSYARGGFLLKGAGTGMITKSANDIYEATTGKRGVVRDTVGDLVYDLFGYALMGYGLFRQVPKINYLGNPKRDFFVRDPLTYESAFMQYSGIELAHTIVGTSITLNNDYDKYKSELSLEIDWRIHLLRTNADHD